MGQAGSTQQQQSDQGGSAAQASSSSSTGGEQQRRTPGRPSLHYTRSLRERHLHQQQQQNGGSSSRESALSRFTSRDGDSKRDGTTATSPTKPRRKSLDMPDMSLSMTGTAGGGGGTPQSAVGTPVQQRTSIFPPRQNSSAAGTPAGSAHTSPKVSLRIPHSDSNASAEDGIAMAPTAVGDSNAQNSNVTANITSPTVSSAALSPAARWARHKDGIKEGFGKKAQPVVEAAVLHAAGTSANQASQNNNAPSLSTSPTTPFQPLSKVSSNTSSQRVKLPPVDTGAHVRRSDAADQSILSPQDNDSSSAQSSGFVIRHNEVHHAPPSAPGQAIDPVHLSSLLKSGQIKEAQKLQAAASGNVEGASETSSRPSSSTREKASPATSNNTVQQHHLIFANAQDSQPPTPGASAFATPVPIPSPLKQPIDTILAPELPAEVPLVIPTVMPSQLSHAITDSTGNPLPAMGAGPASTANDAMAATADYTSPLIPGSTPPLGNPPNTLPAAAPIAALTAELAQDPKAQEAVKNATVDLGAGSDGVATLLTWKAEEETTGASGLDGTGTLLSKVPSQVFVTGTFAKGWSTKIELRRNHDDPKHDKDFTALVNLPPGPHSLKFIVDKQWKTSKYLPSATDADGNLVNYLQVHKVDSLPTGQGPDDGGSDIEEDDEQWTQEIPAVLLAYGDATEAALDAQDAAREADHQRNAQSSSSMPMPNLPQLDQSHQYSPGNNGPSSIPNVLPNQAILALQRKPLSQLQLIQPPSLPAQLEKGVLNATVLVAKGSGDDNSILPKPDHSVLNHLAASPIKGGLLSVGVTTRYRRKYVTTVYYKKPM